MNDPLVCVQAALGWVALVTEIALEPGHELSMHCPLVLVHLLPDLVFKIAERALLPLNVSGGPVGEQLIVICKGSLTEVTFLDGHTFRTGEMGS